MAPSIPPSLHPPYQGGKRRRREGRKEGQRSEGASERAREGEKGFEQGGTDGPRETAAIPEMRGEEREREASKEGGKVDRPLHTPTVAVGRWVGRAGRLFFRTRPRTLEASPHNHVKKGRQRIRIGMRSLIPYHSKRVINDCADNDSPFSPSTNRQPLE